MDTKPLERFATWARRELINAVDAQATAVLAVGSVARSERAEIVKKLEAEIGRHGRQNIVDKVAYTWFNRIIALRFMDARGYTVAGVVSPAQGQAHGQPEILSDAKRGNLDTDVVTNTRTANAIIGLLDGTRRSTDAEGEAYALLLTEYCRYWHMPMPFMFEREGDYTELLVPANLLADGAILARARGVLTEDVCVDVEVIGWLYQFYISERKAEVFAGFKNKKAGAEEIPAATQLFTPHWIVRYLVENSLGRLWMLNRPSSRLVEQMDYFVGTADEDADFLKISGPEELTVIDPACGSGHMLTYAFDLLYAIYEEEGYPPSEIAALILAHNLHGAEIDPRAGSLAAFALAMKARDKQRTFFDRQVKPNVCVIEPISFTPEELDFFVTPGGDRHREKAFWNQFEHADTLGSLIQPDVVLTARLVRHLNNLEDGGDILQSDAIERGRRVTTQARALGASYSTVIANPPYMGSKNMDARLTAFAREHFPDSKSDLFAMFIERCIGLTSERGATAMITMQSWMFISSYEVLRKSIVASNPLSSMIHIGERGFDSIGGSVVSTAAFVLNRAGEAARTAIYIRAVDGQNEKAKRQTILESVRKAGGECWYTASAEDLLRVPGAPVAYWLSGALRDAFDAGQALGETAQPREGLTSTDNAQFKRMWWEVDWSRSCFDASSRNEASSSNARWFPINNGGGFRRWYGNADTLINWFNDGSDLKRFIENKFRVPYSKQIRSERWYFLPSVSLGKIGTSDPSFRVYPSGYVADSASKNLYLSSRVDESQVAAFGNSTVASALLRAMAPTVNFTGQAIAALPYIPVPDVVPGVELLTTVSRNDWNDYETSWDYVAPSWLHAMGTLGDSDEDLESPANSSRLADQFAEASVRWANCSREQQARETENNRIVAEAYGLVGEVPIDVPLRRVSLMRNVEFRYGAGKTVEEYSALERADLAAEFVSYAVGCIFGRYSLDEPGLILATQGATSQDYLAKVSDRTFTPDADNVIPVVDDGWFADDIVERLRQFIRAAFGTDHFEENLRFVEESLGVNALREYFITKAGKSKFYDDHVQRYEKRPIYWMFSSPNGSFNALIYMHRYTPSTVSTVLNEYLREYRAKLEVALASAEQEAAGGGSAKEQKEADRLRKVLVELAEYEHDVLYPLATQQIVIDLDDGVKANYPKFYPALKNIAGLEATE